MKKTVHCTKPNLLLRLLLVLIGMGLISNASAQMTITIGSMTSTTSTYIIPINNLYGYSYTQQIVLSTEIGMPGRIAKIRFKHNAGSMALNDDWTVYLGYKTANSFASTTDWLPLTALTQVYSGTVTASGGWVEITLPAPFIYLPSNGNLVIAVDENSPSYTYTSNMFTTNAGTGRSIYYRADGTNPSPASPPTGTVYAFYNTLQLDMFGLSACSGVPAGGTTVANPTTVCAGSSAALSIANGNIDTGTVFQWQDSVAAGTWQNIAGATSFLYTTPGLTAPRYYRRVITCLASGSTSYSTPVLVNIFSTPMPYIEDFESITANNQLPNCMTSTNTGTLTTTYTAPTGSYNQINHTNNGSKFGSFRYAAGTDAFITPALNLTAGKTYLFSYWYITDGLSGWNTLEAYWGNSPTIAGLTNLIGGAPTTLNNTTYQKFEGTFTPTTSGTYYVGIVCTRTSNPWYLTIDDLFLNELQSCSSTPDAGVINPLTPCPNQPFTLNVAGGTLPTVIGNLSFRWEDSSALTAGTWQTTTGISTNPSLNVAGINMPTKYRRVIICNNTFQQAVTPSLLVVPASFINCFCTPTYATGASANTITNVKLRNLNNTSTGSSPWYANYAPQQPGSIVIPDLTMTSTDTLFVSHSTNATNYSGVWIDFNHNGIFDATEFFTQGTNAGASGIARIAITPPATALPGITRMRIRAADRAVVTATMPCGPTGSAYGEAEDYLVNILYPICNGPTNAGVANATDTAICVGYTVNVWDTTHEYKRSQITWSWQKSIDGGFSWSAVANSTNKDTLNNILITGAVRYRLKMVCDATGDSTFSTSANIRIKAPYECYCYSQSAGGMNDSSDIGSVTIGSMVNTSGGPHVLNPTAVRRRTDYTGIRNIEMSRNERYKLSIYHIQRNGVHADALVTVFIDYNNDLQYNAFATPTSERVFQMVTTAANYYLDTAIIIPNAVIPNVPTGLRVILNNDLNPNSPANLGCGEYVSGETEDYVVTFRAFPQGVGSVGNLEHVSLYPNPTTGKFMVSAGAQKNMDQVEVLVTTVTGNIVLRKSYGHVGTKLAEELDMSEVARGVYFVEVKTTNGDKMVQKLVIR